MWKPIEIKPGDQSLVGQVMRRKFAYGKDRDEIVYSPEFKVLSVTQNSICVHYFPPFNNDEEIWVKAKFEIWEEPTRWVPKEGEEFYQVRSDASVVKEVYENHLDLFEFGLSIGNVYRTREHAELAAKYVREAHARTHEELGE